MSDGRAASALTGFGLTILALNFAGLSTRWSPWLGASVLCPGVVLLLWYLTTPVKAEAPTSGDDAKSKTLMPTNWSEFTWSLILYQPVRLLGFLILLSIAVAGSIKSLELLFEPDVVISGAGLELRSRFGKRQYQKLIHPYGWQDTGVDLRANEKLRIEASGVVNVGYYEYLWDFVSFRMDPGCLVVENNNIKAITTRPTLEYLKHPPSNCEFHPKSRAPGGSWPVDPEPSQWLFEDFRGLKRKDPRYNYDTMRSDFLGTPSVPEQSTYGRLVGYLTDYRNQPKPTQQLKGEGVFDLAAFTETKPAPFGGRLWVAVNDSSDHLHDNMGSFVLVVTVER